MQPAYLPWVGYCQRIALSDVHVVLDHVQLDKSSKTKFTNRNKIRTPEGWSWLTVPLKTKDKQGDLAINQLEIDNEQAWATKHQRSLQHSYARAPHYSAYAPALLAAYQTTWEKLVALLDETTTPFSPACGPVSGSCNGLHRESNFLAINFLAIRRSCR